MRLKAILEVQAGLIPGQAVVEYTRQWLYTSAMYEEDLARPEGARTWFQDLQDLAWRYALALQDPRHLNWVRVEWIWL